MNSYEKCLWDEWNRLEQEISEKSENFEKLETFFGNLLLKVEAENTPSKTVREFSENILPEFEFVGISGNPAARLVDDRNPEAPEPQIKTFHLGQTGIGVHF